MTLSCHHHHHHHPQLPRDISCLCSATRDTWGSISCCCHHFNPPQKTMCSRPVQEPNLLSRHLKQHLPPSPQDLPSWPHKLAQFCPSAHEFQVIWHPHGILPTKLKIIEILPVPTRKPTKIMQSACCACRNTIQAKQEDSPLVPTQLPATPATDAKWPRVPHIHRQQHV